MDRCHGPPSRGCGTGGCASVHLASISQDLKDAPMLWLMISSLFRMLVTALIVAAAAVAVRSQGAELSKQLPNPYRTVENWMTLPAGRKLGSTSGVGVDPDGTSIWVADRCGAFAPPSL